MEFLIEKFALNRERRGGTVGKFSRKTVRAFVLLLAAALLSGDASAAVVRLVYGQSWSRAGRDVKKTLESQAWKSLAKSKYKVECIDESCGGRGVPQNLGSMKLPAIFVLDDKDRCYCVIENVPYRASADWLFRNIDRASELRAEIEKKYGTDTIDGCGQLMLAMERFVGGPKRVISKGFYQDVYEKLKKLDPEDKEGWLRHFTMPFVDHENKNRVCNNSDGVEIVEEATWYRKEKKMDYGEKFIETQMKLPRAHLSKEQQQALLMAKFALYAPEDMNKPWASDKKAEMVKLLKRVAEFNEHTLWGTCALGWLACNAIGEPAFSTYWGWRRGDIPKGKFETTLKYGVTHSFSKAGDYTITFERTEGAAITFDSISLCKGKEEIAKLTKKEPGKEAFTVTLDRAAAGKLTHMILRGTSGGETVGQIKIERTILKPRKEAK